MGYRLSEREREAREVALADVARLHREMVEAERRLTVALKVAAAEGVSVRALASCVGWTRPKVAKALDAATLAVIDGYRRAAE